MTARQPGILINHRGQPFRSLAIGAFPERTKSAGRTDDRQITYFIGSSDFTQLVRHARTTGNARDHSARPVKYAIQHALRAAHFPQHVDIDRALATGQFKRSEEHTSELQSLMRTSYAVFCLKKTHK